MRIFKAYVPNWSRKSDCSITSPLALSSSILQIQALLSFLSMQRMFSSKMFSCENNCLLFGQNDGTIKNSSFISIYIFQMIVQKPDYLNQLVTLLNKSIGNSDTFQITGSFKHILPFRQEIIITSSSSGIMALSQIISKCVFNTNKKKKHRFNSNKIQEAPTLGTKCSISFAHRVHFYVRTTMDQTVGL